MSHEPFKIIYTDSAPDEFKGEYFRGLVFIDNPPALDPVSYMARVKFRDRVLIFPEMDYPIGVVIDRPEDGGEYTDADIMPLLVASKVNREKLRIARAKHHARKKGADK